MHPNEEEPIDKESEEYQRHIDILWDMQRGGRPDPLNQLSSRERRLLDAAQNGDRPGMEKILSHGANINCGDGGSVSVLNYACLAPQDDPELIWWIIEQGADVANNRAALPRAIQRKHLKMAETLLDAGADPNTASLAWAEIFLGLTFMKKMLDRGADIHQADQDGPDAALRIACKNGKVDVVKVLLEYGADLHVVAGGRPEVPLLNAVIYHHPDVVRLLLTRGADPNGSIDGIKFVVYRAITKAYEVKNDEILMEILKSGATPYTMLLNIFSKKPHIFSYVRKKISDMTQLGIMIPGIQEWLKFTDSSIIL